MGIRTGGIARVLARLLLSALVVWDRILGNGWRAEGAGQRLRLLVSLSAAEEGRRGF